MTLYIAIVPAAKDVPVRLFSLDARMWGLIRDLVAWTRCGALVCDHNGAEFMRMLIEGQLVEYVAAA